MSWEFHATCVQKVSGYLAETNSGDLTVLQETRGKDLVITQALFQLNVKMSGCTSGAICEMVSDFFAQTTGRGQLVPLCLALVHGTGTGGAHVGVLAKGSLCESISEYEAVSVRCAIRISAYFSLPKM